MKRRLLAIFLAILTLSLSVMALSSAQAARQNFAAQATPAQDWLAYYRGNSGAGFESMARFITAHPDFPAMDHIGTEAEKVMPANYPDRKILDWFSSRPPRTLRGMVLYEGALRRNGQKEKGRAVVNDWWKTAALSRDEQKDAYEAFKNILDRGSHEDRLRILIHREDYANARAIALLLDKGYSALAETRISLKTGKGNPDAYLKGIPAALLNDEGLLLDRIRYRRRADNNEGAIELLNRSPSSEHMYSPNEWGKERAIIVRRLFEEKKYAQAYKLSAAHRIKHGAGFADNEWMAGWLALEYLDKPWEAFEHFERLYHNVGTPISKARAAYWAGLACERLGHRDIAAKWFAAGAKYSTVFYGQLAAEKLGRGGGVSYSGVTSSPAMKGSSLAHAAGWLKRNGYKTEAAMFLYKMIDVAKTPSDYAAVAEIANGLSMRNIAIRAAQESEKNTGVVLLSYAFPKIENRMGNIDFVEWALVHALIRQESRYDEDAVSSAGARGLMQLMPATAKEVARKAGLTHNTAWLTSQPAHNVALGSRYLRQMLDRYDGNYAMALAAYNAGPSRVNRWIAEIGDPRSADVDLINWIEQIPIYETRNYVQRVLEGVDVYRQALTNNRGTPRGDIHLASR